MSPSGSTSATAIRNFRKHATWYTKGFPGSSRLREQLIRIDSIEELDKILAEIDPDLFFPVVAMRAKRGKKGGTQKVALPDGYLDDLEDARSPGIDSEEHFSGG